MMDARRRLRLTLETRADLLIVEVLRLDDLDGYGPPQPLVLRREDARRRADRDPPPQHVALRHAQRHELRAVERPAVDRTLRHRVLVAAPAARADVQQHRAVVDQLPPLVEEALPRGGQLPAQVA